MSRHQTVGGVLLIGGSCIGVGMLGLPILTGIVGFFPSLLMSFFAFGFMTATALYLIEVGSWFPKEANLSTQIESTLGPFWKSLAWMLYLFLFYSLLVAYIALSGHHLSGVIESIFQTTIPDWVGSLSFVLIFGSIVYLGTHAVDRLNRYLMLGKVLAFMIMIAVGFQYAHFDRLLQDKPEYLLFPLPILVISFGFHNMIPALNSYFNGNTKQVKQAIIGGALLTFVVYVIWQILAIGIIPLDGENGLLASYQIGQDAANAIKNLIQSKSVAYAGQSLALFAILTSFLAQTLSLTHFLADGFKKKELGKLKVTFLALIPPLVLAVSYPDIFYSAIGFAGGVCTVVLFGLIPAMMINTRLKGSFKQVWKKKLVLGSVMIFALFILVNQLLKMMQIDLFPHP